MGGDTGLRSWEEADDVLRQLGTLEARIAQKNAALTEEVNRLRATVEPDVQALELTKARLEKDLEQWCRRHRGDFGGKRSRKLNFGTVGFRLVSKLEVEDEDAAIGALEERGVDGCVAVKKSLVKPEVAKLAGDVLKAIGATVVSTDAFQAKPDRERIELTAEDGR